MRINVGPTEPFPKDGHPLHKHGDKVVFVLGNNMLIQVMGPGVFYIFDKLAGEKVRIDVEQTYVVSEGVAKLSPTKAPVPSPVIKPDAQVKTPDVSALKVSVGAIKIKR
jgi:hypothetical protein